MRLRFEMSVAVVLGLLVTSIVPTSARQPLQQPPRPDVFRATIELVPTDVVVVDRQGQIVDGLQRDQFELRVDGKPQPLAFFERVWAGSLNERAQLMAARGAAITSPPDQPTAPPPQRGRTVLFFVDDLHLAPSSVVRARAALTNFIDGEMGPRDRTAVTSTSGQIGFLQQLTGNKTMLRAAVARLKHRPPAIVDMDRPPITVHQAHLIDAGRGRDLFDLLVKETLRLNWLMKPEAAAASVSGRARQIVSQSSAATRNTLAALEATVRSRAELPGRKIIFFLSDGFELSLDGPEISEGLRQIADAAARANVVIYSLGAAGLATPPGFDAGRSVIFDPTGTLIGADTDELSAVQEALHTLAADTGGRALLNSNALAGAVESALQETSMYYVLAWTPAQDVSQRKRFRRIEVSVRDRPELTVRVRRGFYDAPPAAPTAPPAATSARDRRKPAKSAPLAPASTDDAALLSALRSMYPVTALPISLSLGFMDLEDAGTVLTVSTDVNTTSLKSGAGEGSATSSSVIDLVTAVFNDQGQGVSSLKDRLTPTPASTHVSHNRSFRLKPGLYQVRTAARDGRTGQLGSATEWIEIPNLGAFSMSSLIVERTPPANLSFLTYIYHASRSGAAPDVVLKVEVLRDDKPVIASPLSRLKADGAADPSRIPYSAQLNLEGMPSGSYVLQVTALDRTAAADASQRFTFEIE
jgi:VWFA-related protein